MSSDIWYREYLSVASQLDAMTAERDKLLEKLRAYPDDPAAVMSRSFVDDLGAHFEKLEADLAAERERADAAEMELKRHMPISKYGGLGIEEWKARCDKLREAMRRERDEARAELAAERERATKKDERIDELMGKCVDYAVRQAKLREALEPLLVTAETVFPDRETTRHARAVLKETSDE